MTPSDDQLTAAFDKSITEGVDKLIGADKDYYLIQDFILEWENGGLTGYLYNRIPDFDFIQAAVDSMNTHGLADLASLLTEAVLLFDGYREPDPPATWRAVLGQHDPTGRLAALDGRIGQLKNYGLKP